jgi:hypothetical protein
MWNRLNSCLVICILVPALVLAQPIVMQFKSALYSVPGGGKLTVRVDEVGDTDEPSLVTIEIRDAKNAVKASTPPLNLSLGNPVIITAQVPAGIRQDWFRAIVEVAIPTSLEFHQPTITMEIFDPASLTTRTLPPCAVPIDQMPSSGGGAIGSCDGWHKTSRTSGGN